ncbi:cytochrome-c peroxidase [Stappia sp. MMSF_3263]|uniref:cytochrome-c peroxidase n=1 Tax=Stappia sp. MMSF_3263 TaxID=3046693 RepID=UPI00273E9969|nr:cytochrome c peroxidase [Stappia sp. MMSF_3263]
MPFFRLFVLLWGLCIAVVFVMPALLLREDWQRTSDNGLAATFPAQPVEDDFEALRRAYSRPASDWPSALVEPEVAFVELGPLKIRPRPEGAELQKARLGRRLFEDPQLSVSGHFSCQSCHNRQLGWGDGLRVSVGHARKAGRRNAPPLFGAAYRNAFFWDGRAASLEEQAAGPLLNPVEMANEDLAEVVERLRARPDYVRAFSEVYDDTPIVFSQVADALAAFQRTLERPTRFDRFAAGLPTRFSDEELWGLNLFRGKAGCANCHFGPMLTDEKMHNLGLTFFRRRLQDLGRYEETGDPQDVGLFRTPSLRHVRLTAPYMHNGVLPRLVNVIAFYVQGGGRIRPRNEAEAADPLLPHAMRTSPLLDELDLERAEIEALVAFLETL